MEQLNNHLSSTIGSHKTQQTLDRTRHLFGNWELLHDMSQKKINVGQGQAQGWMLEILETAKFNRVATRAGSNLTAQTTDSLGGIFTQHPADIWVKDANGNIAREAQVKSMDSASKTAFALKDNKYKGMQRIGAKEQNEKVAELVEKRSNAQGSIYQEQYADVKENLAMNGLSHDGIESGGTTRQEAIDATDPKQALKRVRIEQLNDFSFDVHNAGIVAAKIGTIMGGSISTAGNVKKLIFDDVSSVDVVINIATETTQSCLTSYISGATTRVIEHGLHKVLTESTAKSIIKSSAPAAMASSIISCSKSLYHYLSGEIDSEQLADEVSSTAIISASSFYYGAFGQMVIPIPIVGTLIGSTVGYFIGNMLHQSGLISLGKTPAVKAAIERRKKIEEYCLYAIPLMQEKRIVLEELLENYFQERHNQLHQAFNKMDNAFFDDVDSYYSALNDINNIFGKSLPFKTQKEFNDFMLDDSLIFNL